MKTIISGVEEVFVVVTIGHSASQLANPIQLFYLVNALSLSLVMMLFKNGYMI